MCREHGEFWQTPASHVNNRNNCPTCVGNTQSTTEEFTIKATQVHVGVYDYSLVDYIGAHTKVHIMCREHGEFWQTPASHLGGGGCPQCADNTKSTTELFIGKALLIHGNYYNYDDVEYSNRCTKVLINCKTHGVFLQSPAKHLNGQGCPQCGEYGFQKAKPGTLYYLKVKDHDLWKIGITNLTVEARFPKKDLAKLDVIWTKTYENGQDCYDEEQRILQNFKQLQYRGPDILTSGNTELFTEDISPYLQLLS
jgi:hypothetical protein